MGKKELIIKKMAHSCPICDSLCHCGGDIDDIEMGWTEESDNCQHCDEFESDDYDDEDDELRDLDCEVFNQQNSNGETVWVSKTKD